METKERYLPDVIDELVAVAPDLESGLSPIKSSALYAAPELQGELWGRTFHYLNNYAGEHPKKPELAKIFSGYVGGEK